MKINDTECRLSPFGMLMLEGVKQDSVDFKPNYDGEYQEPVTLPSKFPNLLCGNNSGIAVGMGSDLVSHNFTEVAAAINYYLDNKDCTIKDLMQFIKGPDFPTGGRIINGDDLLNIYTTGRGSVRVQAHYDVVKSGQKTLLVFHDLPYGAEIDPGIKAPLKKLVVDDGYDCFESIDVKKVGPHNFDIMITLSKNANVQECINLLFQKTKLADTVKINQNVIVNGQPRTLSLKQLIEYWVDYRSNIIKRIAQNDYNKTNHKLTVTIGLQKCMSDIDTLISLIRNSASRAVAKSAIMKEFELNDEQADAVLDMKLSRLSKLDLTELEDTEKSLRDQVAALKEVIDNENKRYDIIKEDLKEIKKTVGKDERLTEIVHLTPEMADPEKPLIKDEWLIYANGLGESAVGKTIENGLVDVVMAYTVDTIVGYNAAGEFAPIMTPCTPLIGAFVKGKEKIVTVTKNGNIKVTLASDFKFKKAAEKAIKLKDGDELVFAGAADDNDYVMLFNGEKVLKLAVKNLPVASKTTLGVKSGFDIIVNASIVNDSDKMLCITSENKGKLTMVADFTVNNRGNEGQVIAGNTICCKLLENGRSCFYVEPKLGKTFAIEIGKVSVKGRTAAGANITAKAITKIV